MRRFDSIFPFLEQGSQPRHVGRLVANYQFTKALLRYASSDEYVFANTSLSNLRNAVRAWGIPDSQLSRVRYVSYVNLPALLEQRAFHVFREGGWGWFMPGLHYIRARYASNPWPITGIIHSLNGPDVVDHAVRLSHAGIWGTCSGSWRCRRRTASKRGTCWLTTST